MIPRIQGAGGGGGKGGGGGSARVAVEAPDSLQSRQSVRLLDLICEGEIEGLVDGLKSVYLNDTPLQAADGSMNFSGVTLVTREGTQAQTYTPGFDTQETETGVSVKVEAATPVVRTVSNLDADAVRVTLTVPNLSSQDTTNGDLNGTSVQIAIDIKPNGGAYVEQNLGGAEVISGKTRSSYSREYRLPLTGTGPWDVRVRRLTADSASAALQNETYWSSYTTIIDQKLTYPNSATVGLQIDSTYFSSVPSRAYDMKLLRVRVPSNYNPTTRAYTGVWDGTFTVAWTDNPAWCYYDLLTSTRYGLGNYIPEASIDKWSLYTIAQYCDETVPDGKGGFEPRFTCNLLLQSREEAFKVIGDFASVFRGMAYWASGSVYCVQDSPSDPVAIFNQTNVIGGEFVREGAGRKARHTVAIVSWNDPTDLYRLKPEYVEDPEGVARFGIRETSVVAFGCSSQGQAHRVGRWILYTEKYEAEVVSWSAGLDATPVRPGQIVKIVDPSRSNERWGGRVTAATSMSVTLDAPVTLAGGVSYTLSLISADGSVVDRAVSTGAGVVSVIGFGAALPSTDIVGGVWVLGSDNLEPESVRVLAISDEGAGQYKLVAVAHYPSKYDAIEENLTLQVPVVSGLKVQPDAVTNLAGSEYLYKVGGAVLTRMVISFTPSPGAAFYDISYRRADGNFISIPRTSSAHVEVSNAENGAYDLQVTAISGAGAVSASAQATYTVLGKEGIAPSNVSSFTATASRDGVLLEWVEIDDLDRKDYELRYGTTWAASAPIGFLSATAKQLPPQPTGSHTWLIKARDTSLNESATAASVTLVVADPAAVVVTAELVGADVRLKWPAPVTPFEIAGYEIRYGADWAAGAATALKVASSVYQVPVDYLGVRNYMVAALDTAGNIGAQGSASVDISAPGSPTPLLAQSVDNNVLLFWEQAVGSLPIKTYEVRRGTTWAGAEVLGAKSGGFTSVFETEAGSYTYWVAAIDTADNYGTPASTTVAVSQPPDYVLRSDIDSTFSGTLSSAKLEDDGSLLLPVNLTDTFATHFTGNSWAGPQAQITAGYPIYIQPAPASGYYEETVDYGAVLPATRLSINLTGAVIAGTPTVTTRISVSVDGSSYTDYDDVDQVFATGIRYAKYRVTVASTGDDLYQITALNFKLDAKLLNDGGNISCLSSDIGGTEVFFNVPFLDIESLTVTPKATYAVTAVYDFVDAPNPTSFKILLFNSVTGARVSLDASWSAKGN